MKRVFVGLLALIFVLAGALVFNASRLTSRQPRAGTAADLTVDRIAAAQRLAEAVRFQTVTTDDQAPSAPEALPALHAFLDRTFPLAAKNLRRETVGRYSLLYTWTGAHPERPPIILTAHLDVVPADAFTLSQWTHPPFDGVIAGDAVWGRGTLDDKSGVMGLLEAVEGLLARGFTPDRTIYLGFGHNEEGGGASNGAAAIAALLKSRGVHDAVLLDEGGWIYEKIPGTTRHVALVGIAEKGYVSVELTVRSDGGHSSMPPAETAVGILARAVDRVERHPLPARLDGASGALFETLAPEMNLGMRLLFANRWLLRPLILRQLSKQPAMNATIRTTTAPTMLRASAKENVLASTASAVVNFRLLSGDSADTVLAHVTRAIGDPRVNVHLYHDQRGSAPTSVSRIDTPDFAALGGAIRAVFPDVLVAPYLTVGATDARHYGDVAPNLYRFMPIDQPGSTELLHAPNEHILIDVYARAIRAYATIIEALAK